MTDRRSLRAALLAWYDSAKRDLPWRHTRDPYAVWVSEVMLQQTRVDTVLPYYGRFLQRFPTVAELARADEDEVMAAWSGLGYYRRARLLHAGVREVHERYGGEVPADPQARRALPGVGRYTAGALGSICFGLEEPIVDGNVARVLSRVDGLEHPLGSRASEQALWAAAEELVEGERPGDLNQALMELGATVCTPKAPRCDACPLRALCVAFETGRVGELPVPKPRNEPKRVQVAAVVATRGDAVALVRGEGSLFGGLHGPPMTEGHGRARAREALRSAGVQARISNDSKGQLAHVLSHRRLEVEVWRATGARGGRLVPLGELGTVGISSLTQRVLAQAGL
jgi:A/G-specific adenine glycosylase